MIAVASPAERDCRPDPGVPIACRRTRATARLPLPGRLRRRHTSRRHRRERSRAFSGLDDLQLLRDPGGRCAQPGYGGDRRRHLRRLRGPGGRPGAGAEHADRRHGPRQHRGPGHQQLPFPGPAGPGYRRGGGDPQRASGLGRSLRTPPARAPFAPRPGLRGPDGHPGTGGRPHPSGIRGRPEPGVRASEHGRVRSPGGRPIRGLRQDGSVQPCHRCRRYRGVDQPAAGPDARLRRHHRRSLRRLFQRPPEGVGADPESDGDR